MPAHVPSLRAVVGALTVIGAFGLTGAFLFGEPTGHARDAAVSLLTLAWSSAAHVIRSLFKAEEGAKP